MNVTENSCIGTDCCQTRMHESFWTLDISYGSHLNHSSIYTEKFITCDYALLDNEAFNLSAFQLSQDKLRSKVTVE